MAETGKVRSSNRGRGDRNERARNILLRAYWSATGWKQPPELTAADRAYAVDAGYMFPSETVSHDVVVNRLLTARSGIVPTQVGNAFLASLSTRQLDLRSALGSYAVVSHFPAHDYMASPSSPRCAVCGAYAGEDVDYDIRNFERHKWGGVRHLDPVYVAFDLEQFMATPTAAVHPKDVDMFRRILEAVARLEPDARASQLVTALAGVFPSNKEERTVALSLLGYAGVLATPGHPSFSEQYVPYHDRTMPPVSKTDWQYPLWYWRGQYGISPHLLALYFPVVG